MTLPVVGMGRRNGELEPGDPVVGFAGGSTAPSPVFACDTGLKCLSHGLYEGTIDTEFCFS